MVLKKIVGYGILFSPLLIIFGYMTWMNWKAMLYVLLIMAFIVICVWVGLKLVDES